MTKLVFTHSLQLQRTFFLAPSNFFYVYIIEMYSDMMEATCWSEIQCHFLVSNSGSKKCSRFVVPSVRQVGKHR
jgi:hypothetical protein